MIQTEREYVYFYIIRLFHTTNVKVPRELSWCKTSTKPVQIGGRPLIGPYRRGGLSQASQSVTKNPQTVTNSPPPPCPTLFMCLCDSAQLVLGTSAHPSKRRLFGTKPSQVELSWNCVVETLHQFIAQE